MLNPDVTELLDDPELGGGVAFTVIRETRRRTLAAGGSEQVSRNRLAATGNIQPAQMEELQLLAAEEQSERVIVIRSTFSFQIGTDSAAAYMPADLVIYDGAVWKVTRLDHWEPWGFSVAYASLQKGVSPDALD